MADVQVNIEMQPAAPHQPVANNKTEAKNFEVYACRTFVSSNNMEPNWKLCLCGKLRTSHEDTASEWTKDCCCYKVKCNAYGEVKFFPKDKLFVKPAKYLRLCDDSKMDEVFDFLFNTWDLNVDEPQLVVSLLGGFLDGGWVPNNEMRAIAELKRTLYDEGIIKAIKATNGILLTDGWDGSIGRAVRSAQDLVRPKENASALRYSIRAVGMLPWTKLHNRRTLINIPGSSQPKTYDGICTEDKLKDTDTALDRFHTHFLLVDDGEYNCNNLTKFDQFRFLLEKKFSKTKIRRHGKSHRIPVCCILINGGPDSIRQVVDRLQSRMEIIICVGTGGAADLLGTFKDEKGLKEAPMRIDDFIRNFLRKTRLEPQHSRFRYYSTFNKLRSEIKPLIETFFEYEYKESVLFDVNKEPDFLGSILQVLLLHGSDDDGKRMELCIKTGNVDLAKESLIGVSMVENGEQFIGDFVLALDNGNIEFIWLFIDFGLDLHAHFRVEHLNILFQSLIDKKHSNELYQNVLEFGTESSPSSGGLSTEPAGLRDQNVATERQDNIGARGQASRGTGDLRGLDDTQAAQPLLDVTADDDDDDEVDEDEERSKKEFDFRGWNLLHQVVSQAQAPDRQASVSLASQASSNNMSRMVNKILGCANIRLSEPVAAYSQTSSVIHYSPSATTLGSTNSHQATIEQVDYSLLNEFLRRLSSSMYNGRAQGSSTFEDPFLELFLWAILAFKPRFALYFWKQCTEPIQTAVIGTYVCYLFLEQIKGWNETDKKCLTSLKSHLETLAVTMIEQSHLDSIAETERILHRKLKNWSSMSTVRCLDMAALANDEKFIATDACQHIIWDQWNGKAFPNGGTNTVPSTFGKRFKTNALAPSDRFYIEMSLYIIYLLLFASVLRFWVRTVYSYTVLFCTVCYFVDEIHSVYSKAETWRGRGHSWRRSCSVSNLNLVRVISIVLTFMGFILREITITLSWARVFLAGGFIFGMIRLYKYYYVGGRLGPQVVMIWKMMRQLLMFMLVLVVILLSYTVVSRSLVHPDREPSMGMVGELLYPGILVLFGEMQEELPTTDFRECNSTVEGAGTYGCLVRNWSARIFLVLYCFVGAALLMNLLIAAFSFTFDQVQGQHDRLWKYHAFFLVDEYRRKSSFNWIRRCALKPVTWLRHCAAEADASESDAHDPSGDEYTLAFEHKHRLQLLEQIGASDGDSPFAEIKQILHQPERHQPPGNRMRTHLRDGILYREWQQKAQDCWVTHLISVLERNSTVESGLLKGGANSAMDLWSRAFEQIQTVLVEKSAGPSYVSVDVEKYVVFGRMINEIIRQPSHQELRKQIDILINHAVPCVSERLHDALVATISGQQTSSDETSLSLQQRLSHFLQGNPRQLVISSAFESIAPENECATILERMCTLLTNLEYRDDIEQWLEPSKYEILGQTIDMLVTYAAKAIWPSDESNRDGQTRELREAIDVRSQNLSWGITKAFVHQHDDELRRSRVNPRV